MKPIYAETFTAIRDYLSANGYAPTVTELASALGISHTAARKRVLWLVEVGLLTYTPRVHRGIALTGATVYRVCKCGRPITDANAVRIKSRGKRYIRNNCKACYSRECQPHTREWKQRNIELVKASDRAYRLRTRSKAA